MCWLQAAACLRACCLNLACVVRAASLHAVFDSPWRGGDVLRWSSGVAAAPASPSAHSEGPLFFCFFQNSTAILKSFKIQIRLPYSQVEATCRWLTFSCSLLLSEQQSGPSCSLTLAGTPKTLNLTTESNQHAMWDLHKGQYWHTINFHLQFSAWKCFWKTSLCFWLVWERLNGAFKTMIENA